MKIFAIQNAQGNTSASQLNQNNSQKSIVRTNSAGDKFVSKNVSFGAKVSEMRAELARLQEKLAKTSSETKSKEIRAAITRLKAKISLQTSEGGGYTSMAEMAADNPYT